MAMSRKVFALMERMRKTVIAKVKMSRANSFNYPCRKTKLAKLKVKFDLE